MIGRPINNTLHCPVHTLPKWMSVRLLLEVLLYFHSGLSKSTCYLPISGGQKWPSGTFWCPFSTYFHYPSALSLSLSLSSPLLSLWVPSFFLLSIYFFHFTIVLLSLQAIVTDLSNVGSMIECGLFNEALDSIRSHAFPGLLPPATHLISLLEYAQQVGLELPECRNSHLLPLLQEPKGLLCRRIIGFTKVLNVCSTGLYCNRHCLPQSYVLILIGLLIKSFEAPAL